MFETTIQPTEAGQRVRLMAYGGRVPLWAVGQLGTVHRFTRDGNPVIVLDDLCSMDPGPRYTAHVMTDRYGCARLVDADGSWVRPAEEVVSS